jgi:uncharacterized protein
MNTKAASFMFAFAALLVLGAWASLPAGMAEAESPGTILLKDYKPVSLYKVPRTRVEKARHPAIDMHAHPGNARTEEELDRWVAIMDEVGIEKSIVLTMAVGERFDELVRLYSKYPDRFELWCGFDYRGYDQPGFGPAAVAELERCFQAGARGVGELGDKGRGMFYCETKAWGMHFNDPRMDPLLEKCGELGMPVNIHVADPIWMYQPMDNRNDGLMNALRWRLDNRPDILGHSAMIDVLEDAVRKHPKTTFIACHFANLSYDLGRLGELFDRYPNLYADNSARFAETGTIPRFVARFYEKYQDRLVYGTDMGKNPEMYRATFRMLESEDEHYYDPVFSTYHWAMHGLGLPDDVLRKVYRENALRIISR